MCSVLDPGPWPLNPIEHPMKEKIREHTERISKESLLSLFKRARKPLSAEELRQSLKLQKSEKRLVKRVLNDLIRAGQLLRIKSNRFGIPREMNLEVGTLWCTRSGNGFVIPDKEGQKDVFVPAHFLKGAIHGDKVVVRVEHTARREREGRIVKVVERGAKNVVGFVQRQKDYIYLQPEDERIQGHFLIAPSETTPSLSDGDLVAARITRFPEQETGPECRILKVFKGLDDIKSVSQFIAYKHNLPGRFKRKAEAEARAVGMEPLPTERLDLRGTPHVTIDGEFAKDFDDAVFVEKTRDGFVLYVSIADVSHFVQPASSMDFEAYARATSIYFPGSVIPMIPKELSNGICSLNPNEERFTVTARLAYDRFGTLLQSTFHRSIIRSARRLTYRQVEDALVKNDGRAREELSGVMRELEHMGELAGLLKQKRERAGSIDFDLPEPEVVLDMEGGITDILRSERLFSQSIIEECMIAANEAVAHFLEERDTPSVYRVHEPPEKEKLHDFRRLLLALSINYGRESGGRMPLQSILRQVEKTDFEFLVNRVLLRSMKQARYSALNKGHFGLALASYTHFTSPIRRYPDLLIHRILKNTMTGATPPYRTDELEKMCVHLSERERVVLDAERELEDRIRVLFMKDRIGDEYEGVISHITSYGFFVELFDVFVEGIVLLSSLHDDYYAFQEEKFRLVGRRTRRVYRIGDHVRVRVVMADPERNRLHFVLAPSVPSRG